MMNFGVPHLEDNSVSSRIRDIATTMKRNYVVAELTSNLLANDRKSRLAKFSSPQFEKKAVVMMGEPPADYKEFIQKSLLADKQAKIDAEHQKKEQELKRKKLLDEKRKKAEEARLARIAAQRKKEGKDVEEKKESEPQAEEKEEKEDV